MDHPVYGRHTRSWCHICKCAA